MLPEPYFASDEATVYHADCLAVLRELPDESVDAVCTDPPYGLSNTDPRHVAETITRWVNGDRDYLPGGRGFMGKEWDAFVPPVAVWDECIRVLKPGGHALVFAGSRTVDLMTLGLRLAGFDIRDSIAWLYGSGFPKSMDVSKAIDAAAGAEREVVGPGRWNHVKGTADQSGSLIRPGNKHDETAPATAEAKAWSGWATALKPAFEPIIVARKPLAGAVAANVLEHGTGALHIDACRIDGAPRTTHADGNRVGSRAGASSYAVGGEGAKYEGASGRYPANVVLDESQAEALDEQSGILSSGVMRAGTRRQSAGSAVYGRQQDLATSGDTYGDTGGASRFFYTAKAGADERPNVNGVQHPTVKPLDLMRWLARLVTPRGGVVLEPFAGSGTTVEAAVSEGFRCIAVEREAEYLPLIESRLSKPIEQTIDIFGGAA